MNLVMKGTSAELFERTFCVGRKLIKKNKYRFYARSYRFIKGESNNYGTSRNIFDKRR